MHRLQYASIFLPVLILAFQSHAFADEAKTLVVYSEPFDVDRPYDDMRGPTSEVPVSFLTQESPGQLMWFTGAKMEAINADTSKPEADDFLCHSHIRLTTSTDPHSAPKATIAEHAQRFGGMTNQIENMVSLLQGHMNIQLPQGFGVPFWSDEKMVMHSMLLNSSGHPRTKVKFKATVSYTPDSSLKKPIRPLFRRWVRLFVKEGNSAGNSHCEGDSEAQSASGKIPFDYIKAGKLMTHHWMVPPGKHIYRYTTEHEFVLPFDTTIHYASVHLHAYADYIELFDKTTGKTVYKSYAHPFKNHPNLESTDFYSSPKGIPVYKNHRYEIIAQYNNTSGHDINAMALISLYLEDKTFDKTALLKASRVAQAK